MAGNRLIIMYRSWLELPEALTALLVPLPYLFASLAYPHVVGQTRNPTTPLSEAAAESPSSTEQSAANGSQLLHALTLASATLLLAGLVAKIRSSLDQPLDRRKTESSRSPVEALRDTSVLKRVGGNIMGVFLPFYAAMQVGGAKIALVLLTAMTAGFGALDRKPGKHTRWDDLRRTLRTRKATCGALCVGIFADAAVFGYTTATVLGYSALLTSILLVPPPLPTAGFSLITGAQTQNSYSTKGSVRASLPKPSSPLVSTSEDTLLTLASGVLLFVTTILYSSFVSSSLSLSHYAVLFSTLSIASATALVFFSLPSALRSSKHVGLLLGAIVIAAANTWEHLYSWPETLSIPLVYVLFTLAISFDTKSASHSHSHAPHDHSHEHGVDHHLHGNHSRLSAFLIARTTPGSIIHSVMIEKDSRRIAYFGV
jgi:zinc transporter 5/7